MVYSMDFYECLQIREALVDISYYLGNLPLFCIVLIKEFITGRERFARNPASLLARLLKTVTQHAPRKSMKSSFQKHSLGGAWAFDLSRSLHCFTQKQAVSYGEYLKLGLLIFFVKKLVVFFSFP